jgi:hypothetical protein
VRLRQTDEVGSGHIATDAPNDTANASVLRARTTSAITYMWQGQNLQRMWLMCLGASRESLCTDHTGGDLSLASTVALGPLPDAARLPQVDIRMLPQQAVRLLRASDHRRPLPAALTSPSGSGESCYLRHGKALAFQPMQLAIAPESDRCTQGASPGSCARHAGVL